LASWFSPTVLDALLSIRHEILSVPDAALREYLLVTLSSIARRVSRADPGVAPPVRLRADRGSRATAQYRRALVRQTGLGADSVLVEFEKASAANARRMAALRALPSLGAVQVLGATHDAVTSGVPSGSVSLILTSPPYCGAQKYARSLSLEASLLMLGVSTPQVESITLGSDRLNNYGPDLNTPDAEATDYVKEVAKADPKRAAMVAHYVRYLDEFLGEAGRLLRPSGSCLITIGRSTVAGVQVPFDRFLVSRANAHGLVANCVMVDLIPSRGLLTKRKENRPVMKDERVVWLSRKPRGA
jgi:hypothetical protein